MKLYSNRILGIDCGTAIIGWAVLDRLEGFDQKVIDYGDIRTPAGMKLSKRLDIIYDSISTLIDRYKPGDMAVESLFFFKNARTVISVSEARGVILLAGEKKGVKTYDYTPLQVKMAVTGYGRANKKQVQDMITNILKLKVKPKVDDTADALAIAYCHINTNLKNNDS